MTDRIDEILDYWFEDTDEAGYARWFAGTPETDAQIRARFGDLLEPATSGQLDTWADTARGRLALIIVLDQFSRNCHRGDGRAFAGDPVAQRLCLDGLERGHDRQLSLTERWFFYLPLEHAEDLVLQERSVALHQQLLAEAPPDRRKQYEGALDYAIRHRDVVARFGRFPHRNQTLGRVSTDEERAFLAEGKTF